MFFTIWHSGFGVDEVNNKNEKIVYTTLPCGKSSLEKHTHTRTYTHTHTRTHTHTHAHTSVKQNKNSLRQVECSELL